MVGLPASFGSSLGLDLSSPSTSISGAQGGPITNEGWTGPFAVGSGASAKQSNNLPVNNNVPQLNTGGGVVAGLGGSGATLASIFTPMNAITVLLLVIGLGMAKKKGLV